MTRNVGYYSPGRAAEISDIADELVRSGFIAPGGRKKDATPPPHTPLFIKNVSGETLPPYGCAQVTGTYELGGQNYFTVDKPVDEGASSGAYLFNSAFAVSDNQLGVASAGVQVRALSAGGIQPGDRVSPTEGSWSVKQSGGGLFIAGGDDDVAENVVRIFLYPGAASSGSVIEFEITDAGSASESVSVSSTESSSENTTLCDNLANDAPGSATARVIRQPCGSSSVPGEEGGFVTVYDSAAGGFLKERQAEELAGKRGFAAYLSNPDYEEPETSGSSSVSSSIATEPRCQWVIIWIDWFRTVTGVKDIIFGESMITVERHNFKVWDECDLEDEIIEGTDCDEGSSSSGSS